MSTLIDLQVEEVCLVDEDNNPIGNCLKSSVHSYHTPLHRAFSVFLFDGHDRLLVQQRAYSKLTWPGIWSNSCCGHPAPNEETIEAAKRRLRQELNLTGGDLYEAVPDFRYRSRYLGVEENEICPVFIGRIEEVRGFDRCEVESVDWISWKAFLQLTDSGPSSQWGDLSPWSRWEASCLEKLGPLRHEYLMKLNLFSPIKSYEDIRIA